MPTFTTCMKCIVSLQPGFSLAQGKKDQAVEIFKLNLEVYPRSGNAYDSLGEAYESAGQKELAIQSYQRAT